MSALLLDDVVKDLRHLPSLPAVVIDIFNSFDDPNADTGVLADKLARDQALTAKTLRLANSSFYGLARHVSTVQQAITVLGFNSVRTLVTAVAISGNFRDNGHRSFDFQGFWRHSIATALTAKMLARQVRLNQDYAFIAGLLHDIGSLVLATRFPDHYDKVMEFQRANDCTLIEAERAVIGLDHTTAGLSLAEYWSFPSIFRDAIACHHEPKNNTGIDIPALIHVAEAIAHALDLNGNKDELVPQLSDNAWRSLNLDSAAFDAVCRNTEAEFEEACQILRT